MPGGRLTAPDREAIAAGLAAGLSHAEIGRRLGRPTSTISREVSRNGGAPGYRADQAARATARRASRARAEPPGERPAMASATAAAQFFDEWFTPALIQSGVPKMPARVLCCLFTTDAGTLTAGELARRLEVSPGSVSKAVRFLEDQGLLRRERDGRRERYVVDDDLWYQAWVASAQSNAALAEAARQGAELLGLDTRAGARLADMSEFMAFIGADMGRRASQWRASRGGWRPADEPPPGDEQPPER